MKRMRVKWVERRYRNVINMTLRWICLFLFLPRSNAPSRFLFSYPLFFKCVLTFRLIRSHFFFEMECIRIWKKMCITIFFSLCFRIERGRASIWSRSMPNPIKCNDFSYLFIWQKQKSDRKKIWNEYIKRKIQITMLLYNGWKNVYVCIRQKKVTVSTLIFVISWRGNWLNTAFICFKLYLVLFRARTC